MIGKIVPITLCRIERWTLPVLRSRGGRPRGVRGKDIMLISAYRRAKRIVKRLGRHKVKTSARPAAAGEQSDLFPAAASRLPLTHLLMHTNVVLFIASIARRFPRVECGGELYALWTSSLIPLIGFATPSGPHAQHKVARFRQDLDYFGTTNSLLSNDFGLHFLGNWHSHHELGLAEPSAGDVEQVRRLTSQNPRLWCFCQLILSFAENRHVEGARRIAVRAFFYANPQNGKFARIPIRLLSAESPYMTTLENCPLFRSAFDHRLPRLALQDIDLDTEPKGKLMTARSTLPPLLASQLAELPPSLLQASGIAERNGFWLLDFPLSGIVRASLVFAAECADRPISVFINSDDADAPCDVTALVHTDTGSLLELLSQIRKVARRPVILDRVKAATESPSNARRKTDQRSKARI